MKKTIESILRESINIKEEVIKNSLGVIADIAKSVCDSLKNGGKLIIFGNGGSAADAQHIAAELVGRFQKERKALPAIALTVNTSILTALSNDYGYDAVFKRQIEALADKKDIIIAISTSGKAKNVIEGVKMAKKLGIKTVCFSGGNGGELSRLTDVTFIAPSNITARIQEIHITIGHIICQLIEETLFKD
ncbi:MAG: D-sedoheptulose 7-phosphate isomerase [Candidatus Omnitrophota bacterium]|nr:D-sedoheptulose 7-phosphate isomerase [Candidatus Omnitrophota bacterium]